VYFYDMKAVIISDIDEISETTICRLEINNQIQSFDLHWDERKFAILDNAKNIFRFEDIFSKNSSIYYGKLSKIDEKSFIKWMGNTSLLCVYADNSIYIYDQGLHLLIKKELLQDSIIVFPKIDSQVEDEIALFGIQNGNTISTQVVVGYQSYSKKALQVSKQIFKYLFMKNDYLNALKIISLRPSRKASLRNNIICLLENCIKNFYSLKDSAQLITEMLINLTNKYSAEDMDQAKTAIFQKSFIRSANRRIANLLIAVGNYDLVYEFAKEVKDKNILLNLKSHATMRGCVNLAKKIQKKFNKFLAAEMQIDRLDPHFKFYKNIKNLASENDIWMVEDAVKNMMRVQQIEEKDIEGLRSKLYANTE